MPAPQTFTVSQLARETHVPVARIKFYLRERLLRPGDPNAEKRAFYSTEHVHRLWLIHTLRQVAGLPVPAIRVLCQQLDGDGQGDLSRTISQVIDALSPRPRVASAVPARELTRARRELSRWFAAEGMRIRPDARALGDLAHAVAGLRQLFGPEFPVAALKPYLESMRALAEHDFAVIAPLLKDRTSAALAATRGTVLWEPALLLLRRIAHEDVAARKLAPRSRKRAAR